MTLTLVRGLSGAGKNTLAESLSGVIIAADDWFVRYNNGRFHAPSLPQAHRWCQDEAARLLAEGENVIVCNTFSQYWEMHWYVQLPVDRLFIIDLFDGGLTDEELAQRNVHNVPQRAIAAMRSRWEHDWRAARQKYLRGPAHPRGERPQPSIHYRRKA